MSIAYCPLSSNTLPCERSDVRPAKVCVECPSDRPAVGIREKENCIVHHSITNEARKSDRPRWTNIAQQPVSAPHAAT